MKLHNIPFFRVIDVVDGKWTDWQEKFAWWPRKLTIQEYETQLKFEILVVKKPYFCVRLGIGGKVSYRKDPVYRWVWLRRYWRRSRLQLSYIDCILLCEDDYAFDLTDIVKKS